MAFQFSTASRNAALDAIETAIGTSAILRIRTGSAPANCAASRTGTVLVTASLPSDWLAAASGGSKSLSGTWQDTSADATGTAGHFEIMDSGGTVCHIQGTVTATGGAGTPTVTLTYTDQDGNTGATGTFTGVASPPVGTFEIFTLAAGDTGVRAPTSFIQSATRTSGTMHLVLFRVLAQIEVTAANIGNAIDALTSGLPKIHDDSVLQLVWFPSTTTATNFLGQYIETQG